MKNKTILLGSIITITTPFIGVVSCAKNNENKGTIKWEPTEAQIEQGKTKINAIIEYIKTLVPNVALSEEQILSLDKTLLYFIYEGMSPSTIAEVKNLLVAFEIEESKANQITSTITMTMKLLNNGLIPSESSETEITKELTNLQKFISQFVKSSDFSAEKINAILKMLFSTGFDNKEAFNQFLLEIGLNSEFANSISSLFDNNLLIKNGILNVSELELAKSIYAILDKINQEIQRQINDASVSLKDYIDLRITKEILDNFYQLAQKNGAPLPLDQWSENTNEIKPMLNIASIIKKLINKGLKAINSEEIKTFVNLMNWMDKMSAEAIEINPVGTTDQEKKNDFDQKISEITKNKSLKSVIDKNLVDSELSAIALMIKNALSKIPNFTNLLTNGLKNENWADDLELIFDMLWDILIFQMPELSNFDFFKPTIYNELKNFLTDMRTIVFPA